MTPAAIALRQEVASTARLLAAAGLVESFGHVSARTPSGFLITSTRPLLKATADDVILVEAGVAVSGPLRELPLETPMHEAIYRARSDVSAICRGHPPATVTWGVGIDPLPLMHGLGGMAGGRAIRVHPEIELIKSQEAGTAVARTLGEGMSVLLRANGCLSVGADLLEAATRLWFLEERARVVVEARTAGIESRGISAERWAARLGDSHAELVRAKQWMLRSFGPGSSRVPIPKLEEGS